MSNQFPDPHFELIHRRILSAHRRLYSYNILNALILLFTLSSVILLFLLLLNLLFEVSSLVRLLCFAALGIWLVVFWVMKIFPALREIHNPSQPAIFITAKKLGYFDKTVQDAILNYLQLHQNQGSPGSEIIKNMALNQLYRRISQYSFSASTHSFSFLPYLRVVLPVLLATTLSYILFPDSFTLAVKKIFNPWKTYIEPFPVTLRNTSGDLAVLKNDPVTLSAVSTGIRPDNLYLIIEDGLSSSSGGAVGKVALEISSSAEYTYDLPHVHQSFRYHFVAEINQPRFQHRQAISEKAVVRVQERPLIRALQAKITPPAYTALDAMLLPPNSGEITALRGSEVQLSIESDKQLRSAQMIFSDSSFLPLDVAGHTASGKFTVKTPLNYTIRIVDSDSISNSNPVNYSIYTLADEYPYAEIKRPGMDIDLQDELSLPVLIELRDDYGFSGLWLKGAVFRQNIPGDSTLFQVEIPFERLEKAKAISGFTWDLIPFYLVPDDYIQYYAEVFDNDRVTGPKSYRTLAYTIRLPSLLEILSRVEEQQKDQLDKVEEVVRASEQLKEKLKEINRELKKTTEMSWEQQQEIKKQMARQKDVSEKLSEIQKEMDSLIKDMDQQQILSPESLQKYMELQQMFQEIMSPELKQAMEKLQQSIEQADVNQVQKSLEMLQSSLEQFEKNIQRMHELFKRVQLEQHMDNLIKLAEKLNQEQDQINEKLGENNLEQSDFAQLSSMEENIDKLLEFFEQKLAETLQEYQEVIQQTSPKLENAQAYLQAQNIPDKLMNMQQQLQQQQQSGASSTGQNLKSNFEMLQSMVQMAKQDMMMQQKQELAEEMQKVMQDMLSASFDQEFLARRSEKLNNASPQITDIARQQARLLGNTGQMIGELIKISNKTFLLSPQLNQNMAELMSSMAQSISQLENRNPSAASQLQKKSMAGFNQALMSLQNSMNQLGQSSSSSGFEDFMQQLQKMAGDQGQLNQESMALFQGMQQSGGKLPLSSDDLARLAAQQELIRRSLDNLTQQTGSPRDVLGRLNELGNEMEEVVTELKANRFDRRLLERQERILSRMLDAQKSIREKEYSRKREAEREDTPLAKSPPELRKEWLLQEDRLRKQLMDALEEGYSVEYREFIKNYFEILSRQPQLFQ